MISVASALTAVFLWLSSDRTRIHLGNGFEQQDMDLGVLFTELPLVFLAGAALPVLAHTAVAGLLHDRQDRRERRRGRAPRGRSEGDR
ncbi:hypothetical protein QFZ66_004083 [Streptomyces sp. B4I13]|uniref:hypothetical protein n=1 Tax=Streptomyces sp. B4I13 TaxID=3042271 RepID=UPI00277D65B5|nr:hypothetical protein [Streptomyces sp. B4I13]MDQ0960205.1 hypothetical protein [Streptomyces sp. B4I13]